MQCFIFEDTALLQYQMTISQKESAHIVVVVAKQQPVRQDDLVTWSDPDCCSIRVDVDLGGQGRTWVRRKLELLQEAGGEHEELLLGERLPEAVALSDAEWDHSRVLDEFSIWKGI